MYKLQDLVTGRLSSDEIFKLPFSPHGCFAVRQASVCDEPLLNNCASYVVFSYSVERN